MAMALSRMLNEVGSVGRTGRRGRASSASAAARDAALDGVGGIVVARGRGMAGCHQPVDQCLVLGGELVLERAEIVLPLLERARAGDGASDQRIVEHPSDRELAGRDSARLGVALD